MKPKLSFQGSVILCSYSLIPNFCVKFYTQITYRINVEASFKVSLDKGCTRSQCHFSEQFMDAVSGMCGKDYKAQKFCSIKWTSD